MFKYIYISNFRKNINFSSIRGKSCFHLLSVEASILEREAEDFRLSLDYDGQKGGKEMEKAVQSRENAMLRGCIREDVEL